MIGPVGEINLVLWELLLGNEDALALVKRIEEGIKQVKMSAGLEREMSTAV